MQSRLSDATLILHPREGVAVQAPLLGGLVFLSDVSFVALPGSSPCTGLKVLAASDISLTSLNTGTIAGLGVHVTSTRDLE